MVYLSCVAWSGYIDIIHPKNLHIVAIYLSSLLSFIIISRICQQYIDNNKPVKTCTGRAYLTRDASRLDRRLTILTTDSLKLTSLPTLTLLTSLTLKVSRVIGLRWSSDSCRANSLKYFVFVIHGF